MRLIIERSELLAALGHVASVVERRTTIPILSNVLLKASEDSLVLKATDLEREVIEHVPARVDTAGALTVAAHMLHEIVRKLPDGTDIEIKRDGDKERLLLSAGQARFSLQTLSADDFPDLTAGALPQQFEMPAHELRRLIDKTRFAISTEETRLYLNGIFFHVATTGSAKTLRAVATDGHRLAQAEIALPKGGETMPEVIVPRKTVHEIHRLLERGSEMVRIAVSPAKIRFEVGPITLTSKLIDGKFPNYAAVIPQSNDKALRVSNAEFMQAVDRVSTIASERGRAVKLNITPEKVVLSVNNPEGGSATEELAAEYGGQSLEIGFNARYLLDIAGQLESDTAQFLLSDSGSPTIVRDGDDTSVLYVLMPMRV